VQISSCDGGRFTLSGFERRWNGNGDGKPGDYAQSWLCSLVLNPY
jgi:hypothetical protein